MIEVFYYLLASLTVLLLALPWIFIVLLPVGLLAGFLSFPLVFWFIKELSKLKVLVADDDEISLAPLILAFKKNKLTAKLYYVNDGLEALNNIKKNKFDLIILDYMMPGMRGDKVLEQAENLLCDMHSLPVVFYTGNEEMLTQVRTKTFRHFDVKDIWEKSLTLNNLAKKVDFAVAGFQ